MDPILKDCAPDLIDYGNAEGKPMRDLDPIKSGLKAMLNAFPDYQPANLKAKAAGDSVVVTAEWNGTFTNAYMGIPPTAKNFVLQMRRYSPSINLVPFYSIGNHDPGADDHSCH